MDGQYGTGIVMWNFGRDLIILYYYSRHNKINELGFLTFHNMVHNAIDPISCPKPAVQ